MHLANFARAIADDDIINLRLVTILLIEAFLGILNELTIKVVTNKIDGAASETAAHDTRTGDAALFGDVIEKIQFFAAHFVLFTQSFVRAVHLTAYFLVITLNECIADSQHAVFLA